MASTCCCPPFDAISGSDSCHLQRLPPADVCHEWVRRADQHLEWIEQRAALFPWDRPRWSLYRQQVVEWRELWYQLWLCQSYPYYPADRERLAFVRQAIGEDNWRKGHVPPPIASYFLEEQP